MAEPGGFIWYELMSADADRAARFYEAVMGWSVGASGAVDMDYRQIAASDGDMVGGMLGLTAEMQAGGATPMWIGYVHVADVDAELAALWDAGGTRFVDREVPGVGRMAMIGDPQGVPVYLIDPTPPPEAGDKESTAFSPAATGHVAWNELHTPDPAGAEAYYTSRFGWTRAGAMPMGPMGDYVFLNRGETPIGALMRVQGEQTPLWRFYWRTGDIDAARERVVAAGGTIRDEPHQVPGGDWIITADDPEGVFFGMVGSRG